MEANGVPIVPHITSPTAELKVLIDDNDIEGRGRRNGGEHGFEEVRCDIACAIN